MRFQSIKVGGSQDFPISTEGIDKPSPILPQITPSIIVEIVDGPRMHFWVEICGKLLAKTIRQVSDFNFSVGLIQ